MTIGFIDKLCSTKNKIAVVLYTKFGKEEHFVKIGKPFKSKNGDTLIVDNELNIKEVKKK